MREIHGLPKASAIGDKTVDALTLVFNQEPPEIERNSPLSNTVIFDRYKDFYGMQAELCVEAMLQHCPGGFIDALFGELCHHKASVFRVAHK